MKARLTRLAILAVGLALASPANARLSQADLGDVRADPPANATLPLTARLEDLTGHDLTLGEALDAPASVVTFVDYRCSDLCSPIIALTSKALHDGGLSPGKDYRLVLTGFNPSADAVDAQLMADGQIGDAAVRAAARVLLGAPQAIAALKSAAGYHAVLDPDRQRYAHPVALYLTDREGHIKRTLSALTVTPETLRLGLVDAASGRVGNFGDAIRLHCYGFDAATGYYADRVQLLLCTACGMTLVAVAAGLAGLLWTSRAGAAR